MDMIAKELGMDPLELRLRNVLREGDTTHIGETYHQVHGEATSRAAADAAGWDTPKGGAFIGRGMALYDRHTGGGECSATVVAEADGTVTLRTPAFDTGTGAHTILRQIIAEELSLPVEHIRVAIIDTDSGPFDAGVGGSRVTHSAGQATLQAAQQLRQRLLAVAAELLGIPKERVRLRDGRFAADDDSGKGLPLAEVAARAVEGGEAASAQVSYVPQGSREITSFCAQVAEVEVDPETGQVTVRRIVSAHDVGTVLNPMTHQGQIEGGIIQGLGYALMEELKLEEGQVTTGHFGEYKVPTIRDIPKLTTVLLEEPAGPTPYQGKSIGETSNNPVAAAIANAVADAVDVRITSLPITPEKVYMGLRYDEPKG
jgi:CO/xanthine dehydrogenase Mo-binding subunit